MLVRTEHHITKDAFRRLTVSHECEMGHTDIL
jgi:hypothetical protein